jgi:hypothetical protein
MSKPSHVNSKTHSPNNRNRQSRQLPPNTSITSLLHRPIARSRSRRPISPSHRRAQRRSPSNQIRGNETRRLRQLAVNRSLRFDARSERHYRAQSHRSFSLLSARLGIHFRRVEDCVDDVQHAVRDQDVRVDDAGIVGENCPFLVNGDGQLFARERREFRAVAESRAVPDGGALHDVVLQDLGQLLVGDVCGCGCAARGEFLEGVVVWAEDCYVGEGFEGFDEVGGGCGAGESGEVAGDQGRGEAEGDEQEFVDDVDDAVVEFDVLISYSLIRDLFGRLAMGRLTALITWLVALIPAVTTALPSPSNPTATTCPPVTLLPLTSPSSTNPE